MLTFGTKEIKFNEKLFDCNEHDFFKGEIVVIYGASGTGKTTFLNTLLCKNDFISKYVYDGVDITNLTEDETQIFKREHIAYVSQDGDLIENISIKDHLQLLKSMTIIDESKVEELIDTFQLQELLNKYPNELSGGERTRVSFILAIVKDSDILILDEPTSSMDLDNTKSVMKVLQEIKKDKIIIISSHDKELINLSDTTYEIVNQELVLRKEAIHSEEDIKHSKKEDAFSPKQFVKILTNTKHNFKIRSLAFLFTISMIGFSAFVLGFNNFLEKENTALLTSLSSSELIIYKPGGGFSDQGVNFSSEGNELITSQELEIIEAIEGVESLRPRIDIEMMSPAVLMIEDKYIENRKEEYTLYVEDDLESKDKSLDLLDAPYLNTYFQDVDYDNEILLQFQEEGIYLTKELASYLSEDIDALNGKSLTFDVFIPVYNSVGEYTALREDVYYIPNVTKCHIEQITLPIAGILKGSNMGIVNNSMYTIYVESDVLMGLVEEYKATDDRISYILGRYEYSFNEVPEGKEVESEIVETVWTPKSYSLFVEDSSQLETIAYQVSQMGFNVSSGYISVDAVSVVLDSVSSTITIVSYVLSSFVLLMYVVMKYNEKKNELSLSMYLKSTGFTKKQMQDIMIRRYFYATVKLVFGSLVMMLVSIVVFNGIEYGYTLLDSKMVLFCIGVPIIIEFIVPMIMRKCFYD